MKMKKILPFGLLALAAILALLAPSTEVTTVTESQIDTGDTARSLMAGALVLLMTPGWAFFYGGVGREKNVRSTMLQRTISIELVTVIWVVFGFSLAFGEDIGGIIGNPFTFYMMKGMLGNDTWPALPTIPIALFAMFQLKFAVITPALITGAFAERIKFNAYLLF